jgi:hypothetical protein
MRHDPKDFPILDRVHDRPLVFLDIATSSQRACVIEAMDRYYRTTHANVHRMSIPERGSDRAVRARVKDRQVRQCQIEPRDHLRAQYRVDQPSRSRGAPNLSSGDETC